MRRTMIALRASTDEFKGDGVRGSSIQVMFEAGLY